jgi:hypothetical protein
MGKTMFVSALVLAAVVAIAGVFLLVFGRAGAWELIAGDPDLGWFDRSAPARSQSPNDALLCTPGLCDGVTVDRELPDYPGPPDLLIVKIDEALRAVTANVRRVDDGSDPLRARYVTSSPLMGFPDTNSFEAVAMENGRIGLVANARAQLGYSDGGNNRKRLEEIVSRLSD